jgi:hypothetical protein
MNFEREIVMTEKEKARLLAENKRLRRENEYLRHRLSALGEKFPENGETPYEAKFSDASRVASASHKRTYFGYLLGRIKVSMAFRLWDKTRFAVRGFFFASKIWNLLVWLFVILGFGTQFLLFASALMILLPAVLVISLTLGFVGFFAHRKWNQTLSAFFTSKEKLYIIFAPKAWEKHAYFRYMLEELQKDGVVLLVCHSFSACGYRGAKTISDRLCAVHISYYFSLKKHIEGKMIQIY